MERKIKMNSSKSGNHRLNQVFIYIFFAYGLGVLVDLIFYTIGLNFRNTDTQKYVVISLIWGFLRMYTPITATYLSLKNDQTEFIDWLKARTPIDLRNLALFILSPLLILLSLGIYILIYSLFTEIPHELALPISNELKDIPQSAIIIIILVNGYIASITMNALYAFGEEVGWRGFLQEKLGERFNNILSLILTGIIWGGWHFPAMFILGYNDFDINRLGPLQAIYNLTTYMLFTIVVSILMGYIYWLNKNILVTSGIHGAINAYWGLTTLIAKEDQAIYVDISSLASLLLLSLMVYFVYKWKKRNRSIIYIEPL